VNNVVPYYDDIDFLCFQSHFRFTREVVEGSSSKSIFCSTLSEFENFLLCERILINLTTCQNETSS
jgi:hypothetical protein